MSTRDPREKVGGGRLEYWLERDNEGEWSLWWESGWRAGRARHAEIELWKEIEALRAQLAKSIPVGAEPLAWAVQEPRGGEHDFMIFPDKYQAENRCVEIDNDLPEEVPPARPIPLYARADR